MGTTVLGHFPSYINLSHAIGARHFDIGAAVWVALNPPNRWAANRHFLNQMMHARDQFVLSSNPRLARPGSWFFHELFYLRSNRHPVPSVAITAWIP